MISTEPLPSPAPREINAKKRFVIIIIILSRQPTANLQLYSI